MQHWYNDAPLLMQHWNIVYTMMNQHIDSDATLKYRLYHGEPTYWHWCNIDATLRDIIFLLGGGGNNNFPSCNRGVSRSLQIRKWKLPWISTLTIVSFPANTQCNCKVFFLLCNNVIEFLQCCSCIVYLLVWSQEQTQLNLLHRGDKRFIKGIRNIYFPLKVGFLGTFSQCKINVETTLHQCWL